MLAAQATVQQQHKKSASESRLDKAKRRQEKEKAKVDRWFATYSRDDPSLGLSRDSLRALLTDLEPRRPPAEAELDTLCMAATEIVTSKVHLRGSKGGRVPHRKTMEIVRMYKDMLHGAGVPRAGDGVAADSHRALPPPLPHHGARTPLQSHGGRPVQGGAQTSARPNLVLLWLLAAGRPPAGQAGSAGGHGAR